MLAFGQEVGRVLSDGRVVGRAEPFAKVLLHTTRMQVPHQVRGCYGQPYSVD